MSLGSRVALGSIALLALVSPFGCVFVDDDDGHGGYHDDDDGYVEPVDQTAYVTIDADRTLETSLGRGAGLFVEYAQGGDWYVWTSCDTELTGRTCAFQVNVWADGGVTNLEMVAAESDDRIDLGTSSMSLHAQTGYDSDGIRFRSAPGEPVTVELILDGYVEPGYLFWFGDGALNEGSTGTPVVFTPSLP